MTERNVSPAYQKYSKSTSPFLTDNEDENYRGRKGWIVFIKWYQSEGKELFSDAFKEVSGKDIPQARKIEWQFTTGLACTEADCTKKRASSCFNYYRANAFWFLEEVDHIVIRTPNVDESYCDLNILYNQTLEFIRRLIEDSLVLLTECANLRSGSDGPGLYKSPLTLPRDFYVTAQYLIYGGFIVSDNPDASISIIRQALEVRLRQAFGVVVKVDDSGNQFPISLSEIIKVLEQFSKKIEMGRITLPLLKRINSWANMYLHSGIKQYGWVSPRVLNYLSDFLVGGDLAHGYLSTVDSGISTDKKTFEKVRAELERQCKPCTLHTKAPQSCSIIITDESM